LPVIVIGLVVIDVRAGANTAGSVHVAHLVKFESGG